MENHPQFNNLDYIILSLVALSGAVGLMRGLLREVFALVTWTVAYMVAVADYPLAMPWVHRYIHQKEYAEYAAMAAMFCIAFVVFTIIAIIITRLIVRGRTITTLNRSLGFIFGLARGALVVCLLYMLAAMFIWPDIDKDQNGGKPFQIDTGVPTPAELQAAAATDKPIEKIEPAPELVMQARTRPYLAYGAKELKNIIPQEELEKLTQQFVEQRGMAKKKIEEHAQDVMDSAEENAKTMTSPFSEKGR